MRTDAPICDRKLWDSKGNYCRVTLYPYGKDTFELYIHSFNDDTPRRYINSLGICNNIADLFIASQKQHGMMEQLPSYNPEAWRA